MRGKKPVKELTLAVPAQETPVDKFLTSSGTFKDGELRLNQRGLRLISEENEDDHEETNLKVEDVQLSMDDLEMVQVIGKGSGGVVQLVRHKWVGTLYALKGIQMNIQESVRKQIVQELKINQATQSPHIVLCHQSFYHNGVIYLVLEYMDRGSLADIIKQMKTIQESYLAVLCKQILEGLLYLHHERHVIHRDIKPSNLLVNHKGEVKISDFGVSAVLANSVGQRDTFVGTYNYMAPERISGSSYEYKSDIWSLGLVILECAIGRFPYIPSEGEGWLSFYELLEAIVDQPPPSAPADQFSPEFCSFISSCIQKDPAERLSASELLNHPFIKKFEGKDLNLRTLVESLEPPMNIPDASNAAVVVPLEFEVVRLDLVVLELVHPLARRRTGLPAADQVLVRAADGGLGVVGWLARRPHETAVGRGGALDGHGAAAGLALRVDQAAVHGEHPPVLTALATHRGKFQVCFGSVWCGDTRTASEFICRERRGRARFGSLAVTTSCRCRQLGIQVTASTCNRAFASRLRIGPAELMVQAEVARIGP
ncbi:hypothetical protein EJB05_17147 [Eragrostis curvula]|uniref:mitogen-activated protein kinase kinase n=1 Tax=Eragrostis curvula TaxID=38414 RepID=A0A5J9VHA9_9POAL|nr:hypothetical protein EJB05_17147 [Eragrostis curvula]